MRVIIAVWVGAALGIVSGARGNLAAHWRMEEGTGAVTNNAVGGNNDPIAGSAVWLTTGLPTVPSGTTAALAFDGTDDVVNSTYVGIAGNNARSVAFWIRVPNGHTSGGGWVAWGNSSSNGQKWHVRANDSAANGTVGAVRTEIQGSYVIGTTAINDGQWHHVTSVYDPTIGTDFTNRVAMYIDGVLEPTLSVGATGIAVNTLTSSAATGWSAVRIGGRRQGGANEFFLADMDDVRIYDHALSQAEVTGLVPEPSATLVLGLAACAALARRRDPRTS